LVSTYAAHFALEQALERSALSEGLSQTLKTKLQDALREGVALLNTVQQLESDKATLESQLLLLQKDLSNMVRIEYVSHILRVLLILVVGLFAGPCKLRHGPIKEEIPCRYTL
jgi:hypothetical protein